LNLPWKKVQIKEEGFHQGLQEMAGQPWKEDDREGLEGN